MRYLILGILCLLSSSNLLAQGKTHSKATKRLIFQGICGIVVEKKGDQMPGPNKPASTGQPIEREVIIFPLLNITQVEMGDNGFINSVGEVKPLKTMKSGKDGKFCLDMPVGQYSVIVREPKGFYANLFDTKNNIFPVNVKKSSRSDVRIEITHQAVF